MIKYPPIDPKEVYDSLYARSKDRDIEITWQNWSVEVISYLDPCTMESKGNKFIVCDDPAGGRSLKIPEQLAHEIIGNPYFDVAASSDDHSRIEAALNNLSEQDKEIVEKARKYGDGSGNRNMEVSLTVNLNCNWDGDIFYPRVSVDEIADNDTLKYGINWDKVKELQYKAKNEVLNKVAQYKAVVIKIATELKINSRYVHVYIMGWG
jgi:hypothetical protein